MVGEIGGLPSRARAGVVVLGGAGVFLGVDAVAGGHALQLLGPSGDGVLLGVMALAADDLGQDPPPGVDEPVAHLAGGDTLGRSPTVHGYRRQRRQ